MLERKVMVSLATASTEPVRAEGVFNEFTLADRIKRSAVVMVAAVLLAATLIPIPIVHLLGIPLFLIGGVVLAIRQLSMIGRMQPLRIACPKCGELNQVGGGLGLSSIAPGERMCDSCRRRLTLSIELGSDSPVTGSGVRTS